MPPGAAATPALYVVNTRRSGPVHDLFAFESSLFSFS